MVTSLTIDTWENGMLTMTSPNGRLECYFNPASAWLQTPSLLRTALQWTLLSRHTAAATYFVQVAWLNARGEEGVASSITSANAPEQNSVRVNGNNAPGNAVAWNVYAGTSINSIMLQNAIPMHPGQAWLMPDSGVVSGRNPGGGQEPNYFRQLPRYLQRG